MATKVILLLHGDIEAAMNAAKVDAVLTQQQVIEATRHINKVIIKFAIRNAPGEVCVWHHDDAPDDRLWQSNCGHEWMFNAGDPTTNDCRFCHHCGKPIALSPLD